MVATCRVPKSVVTKAMRAPSGEEAGASALATDSRCRSFAGRSSDAAASRTSQSM